MTSHGPGDVELLGPSYGRGTSVGARHFRKEPNIGSAHTQEGELRWQRSRVAQEPVWQPEYFKHPLCKWRSSYGLITSLSSLPESCLHLTLFLKRVSLLSGLVAETTFPCVDTARQLQHSPWDALQGHSNVPVWHCFLYPLRLSPKFFVKTSLATKKKKKKKGGKKIKRSEKKDRKIKIKDKMKNKQKRRKKRENLHRWWAQFQPLLGALDSWASGGSGCAWVFIIHVQYP